MSSLNFQGYGFNPWMQPRLDPTVLGLQPDIFKTMASSAIQDPRGLEKRPNQSLPQFQPNQNVSYQQSSLIQNQFLQQVQSQQTLARSFQESQTVAQNQVHGQLLQQQMQNFRQYDGQQSQQQQLTQFEQLHNQFSDQQQIPKVINKTHSFGSSTQSLPTSLETISSACPQQLFSNSIMNSLTPADISLMQSLLNSFSQDGGSRQVTLPDSNPLVSSSPILSKRVAVDPQLSPSTASCPLPQVEDLGGSQTRLSELSSLFQPLPNREL